MSNLLFQLSTSKNNKYKLPDSITEYIIVQILYIHEANNIKFISILSFEKLCLAIIYLKNRLFEIYGMEIPQYCHLFMTIRKANVSKKIDVDGLVDKTKCMYKQLYDAVINDDVDDYLEEYVYGKKYD